MQSTSTDESKALTLKLIETLREYINAKGNQPASQILGSFAFVIWNLCEEPQGQERVDLLTKLFERISDEERRSGEDVFNKVHEPRN